MTIGEVARRAGVRPSRIRYYERLGLLDAPDRISGWRRYDASVLRWLGLIDAATRLGFSLEETRSLIEGLRGRGFDSRRREALVQRKLAEAKAMAERAETMQRLLEECLESGCLTLEGEAMLDACLELVDSSEQDAAPQPSRNAATISRDRAASE